MALNFSTSYNHMGGNGITGYTSNQGVWSRTQLQQLKGPRKKKRKKWYQNFGANSAIYQISEREEEEDSVPLITPESEYSQSQTASTLTPASNVTYEDLHKELKDALEASVIKETDLTENEAMECTDDTHDKNLEEKHTHRNLPEPKKKHVSEHFFPPISKTNFPFAKHLTSEEIASWRATRTQKVIHSPKYTHIRVPKIHNRQSQFEISEDSPFYLPELDDKTKFHLPSTERNCARIRKPVKVTLTKRVEQAKSLSQSRKRWNLKTLDDPVKYFETPQSAGTAKDNNSATSENDLKRNTISNHDIKTSDISVQGLNITGMKSSSTGEHGVNVSAVNDHTNELDDASEQVVKFINICNSGVRIGCRDFGKVREEIFSNVSPRKKWDYPDHWPRQQGGNGALEIRIHLPFHP